MKHARSAATVRLQVLVCLSNQRALVLVSQALTRKGFAVTTTTTLGELEDAMRFDGFCAIVTVTEAIEPIRHISTLPLVNIREFIREWTDEETGQLTCLFDRAAFVKQISVAAANIPPLLPSGV
ncbi:hypothetical protein DXM27_24865 [Rhizobium rhizogenes]|uniref:Uncharacterized protein n=1 Tax=Rhizobium rhizogenes TaxID=359 RepID=A0AA88JQ22_RHIRH|nr:hypothetical protein [Rhizobium rhizogenes]KAA3497971.1 hypothetical protein DXM27_24865 [Rhizobium rhizogenes]KAA3521784.1 hypothetical protein DXM29_23975 [Agrobacterium tumefaciens]